MATITINGNESATNAVFLGDRYLRCSQATRQVGLGQLPPAADAGEAYYWTHAWQVAQQEALDALANGEGVPFDSASDAIRWLLSSDEA